MQLPALTNCDDWAKQYREIAFHPERLLAGKLTSSGDGELANLAHSKRTD